MKKAIAVLLGIALALALSAEGAAPAVKVGLVLSGAGVMDGSEISEAVLTILALEKAKAQIVFMAPNVAQAKVVRHTDNADQPGQTRNVLEESARISRGNIKDMKGVSAKDLSAVIVVGGLGSVLNLSDFLSKGAACTVNPEFGRLIGEMYAAKKPIGSMCLASATLAKSLAGKEITVTIGSNGSDFAKSLAAMGATNKECSATDIVFDRANLVVSTPAMMVGPSTPDLAAGIEKLVNKVLELAEKK
jgi:enhancing lycopene biosynthesis protein 2